MDLALDLRLAGEGDGQGVERRQGPDVGDPGLPRQVWSDEDSALPDLGNPLTGPGHGEPLLLIERDPIEGENPAIGDRVAAVEGVGNARKPGTRSPDGYRHLEARVEPLPERHLDSRCPKALAPDVDQVTQLVRIDRDRFGHLQLQQAPERSPGGGRLAYLHGRVDPAARTEPFFVAPDLTCRHEAPLPRPLPGLDLDPECLTVRRGEQAHHHQAEPGLFLRRRLFRLEGFWEGRIQGDRTLYCHR